MDEETPWPVAILVRNAAGTIIRALESLAVARDGRPLLVFVIANGCTDRTAALARGFSRDGIEVRVTELAQGDKAAAWNTYVHELAPRSDIHFFLDGDVEAEPGALRRLAEAMQDPVIVTGAIPSTGRDRVGIAQRLERHGRVAGNLYALSGGFIIDLRARSIRLPMGWIGDDFLVAWIAKNDWRGAGRDRPSPRIRIVPAARFRFRSLSPLRPSHYVTYLRRIVRYEIRSRQFNCLSVRDPALGLPADVGELYARTPAALNFRWVGLYTPMTILAVLLIRRAGARWLREHRQSAA